MSRGFSLIEVLVALTVLSIGLLGAAGMLIGGLRDHADAIRHAAVLALLADVADRIRANPAAGVAYDTGAAPAGPSACDEAEPCDSASLAAHDIAHFEAAARALLPQLSPRPRIAFEPATGPVAPARYVISMQWSVAHEPVAADQAALVVLAPPVAGVP